MDTVRVIEIVKSKWHIIALGLVIGLMALCVLGLFALPSEISMSSGSTTYHMKHQ